MEVWNTYLAILIDHAPAHAPQLVSYQRIITSAKNQYPLAAWLNYDVRFRTLAASDHSLRWDIQLTDLLLEYFLVLLPILPDGLVFTVGLQLTTLKIVFFILNSCPDNQEDNPHPLCQHLLEDHPHQLAYPSLKTTSMTVDIPWTSQAAKGHDGHAMPSSAIALPVTSYMCAKYAVPTTVPGSVPTGTGPLFKSTP